MHDRLPPNRVSSCNVNCDPRKFLQISNNIAKRKQVRHRYSANQQFTYDFLLLFHASIVLRDKNIPNITYFTESRDSNKSDVRRFSESTTKKGFQQLNHSAYTQTYFTSEAKMVNKTKFVHCTAAAYCLLLLL